jgi:hypothetical protein
MSEWMNEIINHRDLLLADSYSDISHLFNQLIAYLLHLKGFPLPQESLGEYNEVHNYDN